MSDTLENLAYVLAGGLLAFVSRSVEARWTGAGAVWGSLRACSDDIRRLITLLMGDLPVGKDLSQLEADCLRFREALVANPRFGEEYWRLNRQLFFAIRMVQGGDSEGLTTLQNLHSTFHQVNKLGRLGFFFLGANRHLQQIRKVRSIRPNKVDESDAKPE